MARQSSRPSLHTANASPQDFSGAVRLLPVRTPCIETYTALIDYGFGSRAVVRLHRRRHEPFDTGFAPALAQGVYEINPLKEVKMVSEAQGLAVRFWNVDFQ